MDWDCPLRSSRAVVLSATAVRSVVLWKAPTAQDGVSAIHVLQRQQKYVR